MYEVQTTTKEAHKLSVLSRVAEDSSFDGAYVVMNVLATVVACYGLLEDSAAVVIGAMIIATLLGPISGVGLALADGDNRLLAKASASLGGGAFLVLLTAFLIGLLHREIPATTEMLARTSPNVFDLMIALGAGAAGAYAMVHKRLSVAFVGVAISTAVVPPLATAAMFLARGQIALSGGAFLLAFANIVGIQFACAVVFFVSGFRKVTKHRTLDIVSMSILLIVGVLLTINFRSAIAKQLYESAVRSTLKDEMLTYPGAYLADLRFSPAADLNVIRATVRGPQEFSAEQVAIMESRLPTSPGHKAAALLIRYVHTTVMSAKGPLYSTEDTGAEKDSR